MPEDIQTWTRFDKRAKTYRTTSYSGPLWENVSARNMIDDKTGHIMSRLHTNTDNIVFASKRFRVLGRPAAGASLPPPPSPKSWVPQTDPGTGGEGAFFVG